MLNKVNNLSRKLETVNLYVTVPHNLVSWTSIIILERRKKIKFTVFHNYIDIVLTARGRLFSVVEATI